MFGLKLYTKNGQSNPVPDFYSMQVAEAQNLAQKAKLKVEVIDSSYNNEVAPGAIIDQVPEKGFGVKENRTVFLTINSKMPEQVIVPKLTNISFRQAQVLIENSGLVIGNIIYQPSEFNDLVLDVQKDSMQITAGEKLIKGESIDLVVGRVEGNTSTPLPSLIGLSINEASVELTNAMLNRGVIIYDESILSAEDSLNARVWKQRPTPKIQRDVNLGSNIDIWVTVDQLKIEDASQQNF
jgi:beta-lactam-binding protein with PASTA domain